MELDEFKTHWNTIQDNELQKQKISQQKLEQIIMNATETLSQLQAKSIYWKSVGKITTRMFIGVLTVVLLITLIKDFFSYNTFGGIMLSIAYFAVMVVYCVVTMWVYKKQEKIFTIYNSSNVKESLKQTINAFKRFYLMFNGIYLVLYPAFYYAIIKELITYWHPSVQTIVITLTVVTVLSLAGGHWYYEVKFFKKLRLLEANLADLEDMQPA